MSWVLCVPARHYEEREPSMSACGYERVYYAVAYSANVAWLRLKVSVYYLFQSLKAVASPQAPLILIISHQA